MVLNAVIEVISLWYWMQLTHIIYADRNKWFLADWWLFYTGDVWCYDTNAESIPVWLGIFATGLHSGNDDFVQNRRCYLNECEHAKPTVLLWQWCSTCLLFYLCHSGRFCAILAASIMWRPNQYRSALLLLMALKSLFSAVIVKIIVLGCKSRHIGL